VVSGYCRKHAATLHRYDWLAGTTRSLTQELVAATGRPWMNSRISQEQARWLVGRAATAPWDGVAQAALLRDADPVVRDGLYDAADRLYRHFHQDRPKGVNHAKISKCLYLMRPGLFPILDSRLMALHRRPALAAARDLAVRCDRPRVRRAHWAAVRLDVLRSADALERLREWMRDGGGTVADAADRLSDVRLLDILAWSSSGRRQRAASPAVQ
jgi:hypothetical protein